MEIIIIDFIMFLTVEIEIWGKWNKNWWYIIDKIDDVKSNLCFQ